MSEGGCACGPPQGACGSLQGDGVHVDIFPKYTTLIGDVGSGYAYYSESFDVTQFNELDIEIVIAAISGTVDADVEISSDGIQWRRPGDTAHQALSTATPAQLSLSGPQRFARLVFHNWSSTTAYLGFWAAGVFRNS